MKHRIIKKYRCEVCGSKGGIIIRDTNINDTITDDDVRRFVNESAVNLYKFDWCDKCKSTTLHKHIIWEGVD